MLFSSRIIFELFLPGLKVITGQLFALGVPIYQQKTLAQGTPSYINLRGTVHNYKVVIKIRSKQYLATGPYQPTHMNLKKLSALFGKNQPVQSHSLPPNSLNPQNSVLHDASGVQARGQLVHVLLRDLVRKSGMPQGWVLCQTEVIDNGARDQGIYVRLIVKHWDERLMTYAFAFQKALLSNIMQFEPKASDWLYGMTWQLDVANTCPFGELPGPEFWLTPSIVDIVLPDSALPLPSQIDVPAGKQDYAIQDKTAQNDTARDDTAQDDTAQDLERLFAIRDKELANLAGNNLTPAAYQSTKSPALQKS